MAIRSNPQSSILNPQFSILNPASESERHTHGLFH